MSRLKKFNFKDPNIVYPIRLGLKFSFVYLPNKHRVPTPTHDFIKFTQMTGNEILLHLEKPAELRPSELASALLELANRDK